MEPFRELMRELYKAQGFIVIGTLATSPRFQVGDQINRLFEYDFLDGTTFRIFQHSTPAEAEKQNELIAKLRPTWERVCSAPQDGSHYYRVIALRRQTL